MANQQPVPATGRLVPVERGQPQPAELLPVGSAEAQRQNRDAVRLARRGRGWCRTIGSSWTDPYGS